MTGNGFSAGARTPADESRRGFPYLQFAAALAATAAAAFILRGPSAETVWRTVTLSVLLFAAVCDAVSRRVSNHTVAALFICGFFGIGGPLDLIPRVAAAAALFLPLALIYRFRRNLSPGGADIKILAALGFAFGFGGVFLSLAFTFGFCLLFFAGAAIFFSLKKDGRSVRKLAIPLVPFIFAGSAVYCLFF